jgi:hypothetical protein
MAIGFAIEQARMRPDLAQLSKRVADKGLLQRFF